MDAAMPSSDLEGGMDLSGDLDPKDAAAADGVMGDAGATPDKAPGSDAVFLDGPAVILDSGAKVEPPEEGCSCSAGEARGEPVGLLLLLLAGALIMRRKRG